MNATDAAIKDTYCIQTIENIKHRLKKKEKRFKKLETQSIYADSSVTN